MEKKWNVISSAYGISFWGHESFLEPCGADSFVETVDALGISDLHGLTG